MTTTYQAMIFYWVLVGIFATVAYRFSRGDQWMDAAIGVFLALLLNAILYKYNRASFTE